MSIRGKYVAAAAGVALVAALAVRRLAFRPLLLPSGATTTQANHMAIGEEAHFGFNGPSARGDAVVRVRDVRLTGVPRGMRVVAIRAVRSPLGVPLVGSAHGDLQKAFPDAPPFEFDPVSKITIRGGGPIRPDHYILVTVVATEPGTWKTTGIDIDWQGAWWQRGTTHYDWRVAVSTDAA